MSKYYKIKVGIEEFSVDESDLPRIVQAMKSGDMVRLDCGLFRGQAILALCQDQEREKLELMLASTAPTPEQLEIARVENERKEIIAKQMAECKICTEKKGWQFVDNGHGGIAVRRCGCTILKVDIKNKQT